MTTKEKAQFFHQLAALLNAGISVERSLSMAGKDGNPAFQRYINKVGAGVRVGQDLASAMAVDSRYFGDWTISLIRLTEYSGSLAETCRRLAIAYEVQQRRERLYHSFKLSAIAIISSLGLVVAVLFNQNPMQPSFWLSIIGLGLLLFGVNLLVSRYGSRSLQRFIAGFPGLGKLMQVRSLLYLAELELPLSCGVSIFTALELVRDRIPDPVMAKNLAIAASSVRAGNTLSDSLQGHLPPLAIQMISTGEETGNLDAAFQKLAQYYEGELERSLRQLEGIMRPLSILAIGAVVLILGIRLISSLINSLPG
ncbi:MAG TPA: type II secretion system F family protein [Candidatus Obscuribacterales bacterium]